MEVSNPTTMEGKSMKGQKFEVILGSKVNMNIYYKYEHVSSMDYTRLCLNPLPPKKESIYSIWETEEEA